MTRHQERIINKEFVQRSTRHGEPVARPWRAEAESTS